jgi:amidase
MLAPRAAGLRPARIIRHSHTRAAAAALPDWVADARAKAPTAFLPDPEGRHWADAPTTPTTTTPAAPPPLLAGVLLAVKDTYDVAGQPTGFGNPTWRAAHPRAVTTAPAVAALQAAGARLVGRAICDELTFGLEGCNAHDGSPANPAAPGRTCGGSSSGCAAAVASGAVHVALGSDTGGSVRLPASFTGTFGFRPTHGAVSLAGACALAPSYDTAGWFASSAALLRAAGEVLLSTGGGPKTTRPHRRALTRWLVAADAFDAAQPATAAALYAAVSVAKPALDALFTGGGPTEVSAAPAALPGGLAAAAAAFRVTQAAEVTATLGPWVNGPAAPVLGPTIAARLAWAAGVPAAEVEAGAAARAAVRAHLDAVLGEDGVLMLPAAPGPPPAPGQSEDADAARTAILALTAPAGLAGLPQAVIPCATIAGEGPVGLGLVGPRGCDAELLRVAEAVAAALGRA